jgi:hypothetical protein
MWFQLHESIIFANGNKFMLICDKQCFLICRERKVRLLKNFRKSVLERLSLKMDCLMVMSLLLEVCRIGIRKDKCL